MLLIIQTVCELCAKHMLYTYKLGVRACMTEFSVARTVCSYSMQTRVLQVKGWWCQCRQGERTTKMALSLRHTLAPTYPLWGFWAAVSYSCSCEEATVDAEVHAETEVYGSDIIKCLTGWLCVHWGLMCNQRMTVSQWCESGSRTAASVATGFGI